MSGGAGRTAQDWVAAFVDAVLAQQECTQRGDWRKGNCHSDTFTRIARHLLACGDNGIDAFAELLTHPSEDVRCTAAAFLLKDRTAMAVATLRPLTKSKGLAGLGARETLKRYEQGVLEIK